MKIYLKIEYINIFKGIIYQMSKNVISKFG